MLEDESANSSELESRGHLDVPGSVNHTPTASGYAEVTVAGASVDGPKSVPVKCVGDVELKENKLAFSNSRSLDNRKILVLVPRTSPPPHYRRQIPENVSAPCRQGRCAGIEISCTIPWRG